MALIGFVGRWLSNSRMAWQIFLVLGVLPVLFVGIYTQNLLKTAGMRPGKSKKTCWSSSSSWRRNQPGTTVAIAFKGYADIGAYDQPPLYSAWEISDALRVLYEGYRL